MSDQKLTESEGYFYRINYDDGDVLDRTTYAETGKAIKSEKGCRTEAKQASAQLRATVDACHGASVIAEYRSGKEVE